MATPPLTTLPQSTFDFSQQNYKDPNGINWNWYGPGQGTSGYAQDAGSGSSWVNPVQTNLGDQFYKDLGYSGQAWDSNWMGGDSDTTYSMNPQFQQWLTDQGLTYGQGTQGSMTHRGYFDKNGQLVGKMNSSNSDPGALWDLASMFLGGYGLSGMMGGLGAGAEAVGGTGNGAFLGEGVASGIPGWDAAAGGAATGFGSGTPYVFNAAQDSQLANLGGDAVWGGAGNGMTGSTVATNAPSGVNLGSLGGIMSTAGGVGAAAGAVGAGGTTAVAPGGAKTIGDILKGVGGNLAGNLTSPNGLAGLLGLWNANNQKNHWQTQMDELNKNFATDSPYAQMMEQTLARKDSAAGRNSQYGPRSVELAAKLAEAKANSVKDLITMQNYENMAQNSGIRDLATILGGGGENSIFSGLSTGFQDLLKLLGDGE